MASSPDAVSYMEQNIGLLATPSRDGVGYFEENAGCQTTLVATGVSYFEENLGFPLPTSINVEQPQMGWGAPMVPPKVAILLVESAKAVAYTPENVGAETTTSKDAATYNYEGDVTP